MNDRHAVAAAEDSSVDTANSSPATAAQVCVIGAGISGLTAAKALKTAGVTFEGFERGSDIGGMWRYENDSGASSAYRSLHIDSSRQSLAYPDFPLPPDLPDYPSHWQMLQHFEAYAERFGLREDFRFRTVVQSVKPSPDGRWDVTIETLGSGEAKTQTRRYAQVIVANGHLSDPKMPEFPGVFDGTATHSHHYRTATPFEDRRVLVVGIGNSAVDIAVDLAKHANWVFLSTRRSAWIMPKYIAGIPTDRCLRFLTGRLRLPVPAARGVLHAVARLAIGDQTRFGLPRPEHPVWREHATVSQDLLPYLGHGRIAIKPNVQALEGDAVSFQDGSRENIDVIIYATGYRISFPFLDPAVFRVENGVPPPLYRRMVSVDNPGLFFSGLVQPIGPTIPLVEIQGRWLAAILSGRLALPHRSEMVAEIERHRRHVAKRYVQAARYTLEVDFREYAAEMTADLDAARQVGQ